MTALIAFLSPILPYLLSCLAVIAGYLFIKQKGVSPERERQEAEQAEARAKLERQVSEAVSKDAEIDNQTAAKIEEVKQAHTVPPADSSGDRFKF
jgi:hypothetical protein